MLFMSNTASAWSQHVYQRCCFFSEKPITIVPTLDKKELDLYKLFTLVVQRGGLFQVVKGKLWREITKELELSPGIRNDAYNLRTQ